MFLRNFGPLLLVLCTAVPAQAVTRFRTSLDDAAASESIDESERSPRRVRTSLDEAEVASAPSLERRFRLTLDEAAPLELRRIRGTLDETGSVLFPLAELPRATSARLIRLSLDDGHAAYGLLSAQAPTARRLRLTLD